MLAAIARIGAVAVPISTMISANELVRVLRQSDVAGLIVQRKLLGNDYVDRLCDALPELAPLRPGPAHRQMPFLRWIVSDRRRPAGRVPADGLADRRRRPVSEELLSEVESEVHATDQMLEIYTSGSMALPKGVQALPRPGAVPRALHPPAWSDFKRGQGIARAAADVLGRRPDDVPDAQLGWPAPSRVCTEATLTTAAGDGQRPGRRRPRN